MMPWLNVQLSTAARLQLRAPGVSLQIVDFDGESLRRTLPAIVKTLEGALSAGGRVSNHPS